MFIAPPCPRSVSVRALVWVAWLGVLLSGGLLGLSARAQEPPADVSPPAEPAPTVEDDGTAALPSTPSDDEAARRHAASQFHRELRSVEEEVSQLKERVFRSKATLKLLKELVVDAAASGSRVMLWHVNELGGGYGLESVQYFLDGKNVFTRIAPDGSLDDIDEIKLHEQTLPPGEHTLQVNLVLRGKGHRIFSYLESFQFKVQSSYTFNIEEGKVSLIRVVLDSRGGFKNFEDRPTVRYDERKHTFRESEDGGVAERPGGSTGRGESRRDKSSRTRKRGQGRRCAALSH